MDDQTGAALAVTQGDREAAADVVRLYRRDAHSNWQGRIRKGECGDGAMVQAFARHRADAMEDAVVSIAKAAHAIGWQAGIGGMETAGAIISYLAQHQDQIAPFFRGDVSPVDWPDFTDGGCLTWHAAKGGKIVHPAAIRAAREGKAS